MRAKLAILGGGLYLKQTGSPQVRALLFYAGHIYASKLATVGGRIAGIKPAIRGERALPKSKRQPDMRDLLFLCIPLA